MKTLKIIPALTVILIVSFVIGCSDQLISPPESENFKLLKRSDKKYIPLADESLSTNQTFRAQIRLRPFASYTFNEANSGFVELNAIDIWIISIDPYNERRPSECQDILVYGKGTTSVDGSTVDDGLLSCHSKGFSLKEIVVENTGVKTMDLDIQLVGVKKKISIPVDSE